MKKILVIEDEEFVLKNIQEVLELNGYSVLTSENGKKGLEMISTEKPDLVLCDIMLPNMDGYEIKKQLDSGPETCTIPFIYLTAKSDMKDLRKGMRLGADDYLVKPFSIPELLNAIETRINKKEQIYRSANQTGTADGSHFQPNDKILLRENKTGFFIDIKNIVKIEAEGVYSYVYINNGKKVLARKILKEWKETLPEKLFVRVHRSCIVNMNYVERAQTLSNGRYIIYFTTENKPVYASKKYSKLIKEHFKA